MHFSNEQPVSTKITAILIKMRPESIFSKFGLVFVASDKIWWLEFIGSVTGSGNAPQEADMWL